ncbi:site-2 protease family protein [Candidatus Gottesmanbacteria bacterium]|nr:site-2 protease family protein [Candidatus Gottesmanbacteria bacterium]
MLTLIAFIILLSILVLVHELGHFLAAKKIGVKVEEFGLGYPPRIFGKKVGETIYSLNALPFGGFVRLYGEESAEQNLTSKTKKSQSKQNSALQRAFFNRSKIERSIILVAGVAMNFLLGVVVISYLFTQGVAIPNGALVEEVVPKTPAEIAGIKKGDVITSVNGQTIASAGDLVSQTKQNVLKIVTLQIKRCEKTCANLKISLIPRKDYPQNEGAMGVAIVTDFMIKTYSLWEAPIKGTIEAFRMSWFIAKGVGQVLWQLVSSFTVPKDVAGPIGIYKVTGQALQFGGLMGVLQLLALLSLNLAVINILPIPALDGGRFFLVLVEAVMGRQRIIKIEKVAQSVGMALILALIVLITISDLSKLTTVQNFLKGFKLGF